MIEFFNKSYIYGYREVNSSLLFQRDFYRDNKKDIGNSNNSSSQIVLFKYGNILKNAGDILLCPVSKDFILSNPLSKQLDQKEKGALEKKILHFNSKSVEFKTEHCIFLPIRNLKYRGIILLQMDFYSENRVEKNLSRIAEAFQLAYKYNCCKITLPKNITYDPDFTTDMIEDELAMINKCLPLCDIKVNFLIEVIFNKFEDPNCKFYHRRYKSAYERFPYTKR